MKNIKLSIVSIFVLILSGCNDFLSELPTKSTNDPIERIEQLEVLFNSPLQMRSHNNPANYTTDDHEITPELYAARPSNFGSQMYWYIFDWESAENEAADVLWSTHWDQIFKMNLIIENVNEVTGEQALKDNVKAEAHFHRAYSLWLLANYYCLPYAPENMDEPGLPHRTGVTMVENIKRQTLRETYEWIEADLAEAMKITTVTPQYSFRADQATVQAFMARYYLFKGEYDNAVKAADFALQNKGSVALKDLNTLKAGSPTWMGDLPNPEYYDYSTKQMVEHPEHFFMGWSYTGNQYNMVSQSLVDMFPEGDNDMRFKWFFQWDGQKRLGIESPSVYRYTQFGDGTYFINGPSIQEVMLTKAEALARLDPAGNLNTALGLVNELRAKRLSPDTPGGYELTATPATILKVVLDERRREFPFSLRFWDIRRFAWNETTEDDVVITRNFIEHKGNAGFDVARPKTYTLDLKSRRYAMPINGVDIDASKGQIEQNRY